MSANSPSSNEEASIAELLAEATARVNDRDPQIGRATEEWNTVSDILPKDTEAWSSWLETAATRKALQRLEEDADNSYGSLLMKTRRHDRHGLVKALKVIGTEIGVETTSASLEYQRLTKATVAARLMISEAMDVASNQVENLHIVDHSAA